MSEEIARAYARPERQIVAYDEPIVPRTEYENALRESRHLIEQLRRHNQVLQDRLVAVNALPPGGDNDEFEPDELPL